MQELPFFILSTPEKEWLGERVKHNYLPEKLYLEGLVERS